MSRTIPHNGEMTKRELDVTEPDCSIDPDGLLDGPEAEAAEESDDGGDGRPGRTKSPVRTSEVLTRR